MNGKLVEMTVFVPVSRYVKVEAAAAEDSRSPDSTASFLLSDWVMATHARAEERRSDMDAPNTVGPSKGGMNA